MTFAECHAEAFRRLGMSEGEIKARFEYATAMMACPREKIQRLIACQVKEPEELIHRMMEIFKDDNLMNKVEESLNQWASRQ